MSLTSKQLAYAEKSQAKLVNICQSLPEVQVEVAGEDHLAFKIRKKIFGYYLFDHHGDGKIAFCCKSTLSEQRRLVQEDPDNFFVPAYVGPKGWVAIRLDSEQVDWEIVTHLARRAYQAIAPRKLAVAVDE